MHGSRAFGAERITCDGFDFIPAVTVINFLCVHSLVMTETFPSTRKSTYFFVYKSHSILKRNNFTYKPWIYLPEELFNNLTEFPGT
jgi:hypothetical protein